MRKGGFGGRPTLMTKHVVVNLLFSEIVGWFAVGIKSLVLFQQILMKQKKISTAAGFPSSHGKFFNGRLALPSP